MGSTSRSRSIQGSKKVRPVLPRSRGAVEREHRRSDDGDSLCQKMPSRPMSQPTFTAGRRGWTQSAEAVMGIRTYARECAAPVAAFALIAAFGLTGCESSGGAGAGAFSPGQAGQAGGAVKAGTMATDFTTRDIDGRTVRLSEYLGKQAILLDFWSTFCRPVHGRDASSPAGLRGQQGERVRRYCGIDRTGPKPSPKCQVSQSGNGMTFPVVLDEDSRIASIYNPRKCLHCRFLSTNRGRLRPCAKATIPATKSSSRRMWRVSSTRPAYRSNVALK